MAHILTCDHNSLHFFICIYTWFCDFIEPKYRSRSCDNTRTVIYISAKKKVLQVRILDFYHKLFPWAWMIPLSLTAVAYMSIVMFVHDDYTTCLKIIKLINCITHVMIILGPCRNNAFFFWVTNFRQELLSLLFCVCAHVVHVMLHTRKCKLTQFPQKQNNKSDWCWSATESHSSWSCRVFRVFGHRCQIQIQQVSSFKRVNKVPWYSS